MGCFLNSVYIFFILKIFENGILLKSILRWSWQCTKTDGPCTATTGLVPNRTRTVPNSTEVVFPQMHHTYLEIIKFKFCSRWRWFYLLRVRFSLGTNKWNSRRLVFIYLALKTSLWNLIEKTQTSYRKSVENRNLISSNLPTTLYIYITREKKENVKTADTERVQTKFCVFESCWLDI